MGIEPTRPAWKAGILAIELHPHLNKKYNTTTENNSQVFFAKKLRGENSTFSPLINLYKIKIRVPSGQGLKVPYIDFIILTNI